MSLFGSKEKEEIKNLKEDIQKLEKELENTVITENKLSSIIKEQEAEIQKLKKSPFDKQFEKITLEFDRVKQENFILREEKNNLEKELLESKDLLAQVKKELEDLKKSGGEKTFGEPKYKVLIKDLYSARKHDEFKKICENLGVVYVDELENFDFDKLVEEGHSKIKIMNAKDLYLQFKNNEYSYEVKEYIAYGHKVSKLFFRYRSFIAYLKEHKIEYISQLENFDFNQLKEEGFSEAQIKKLKEKLDEYNNLRRI